MATHLVTGAGAGIGSLVARKLADRGDHLVLTARSEARADDVRRDFPGADVRVLDLADPRVDEVLAGWDDVDRLDSVVQSAAQEGLSPVEALSAVDFARMLAVNVVAPAAISRWALPALRRAKGTVVFVNAGVSRGARADWGAYAASKAGLTAVADALRDEHDAAGVRVSNVLLGRVDTDMQRRVREQEDAPYEAGDYLDPVTVANAIIGIIDTPRDATVVDVLLRPAPASR